MRSLLPARSVSPGWASSWLSRLAVEPSRMWAKCCTGDCFEGVSFGWLLADWGGSWSLLKRYIYHKRGLSSLYNARAGYATTRSVGAVRGTHLLMGMLASCGCS